MAKTKMELAEISTYNCWGVLFLIHLKEKLYCTNLLSFLLKYFSSGHENKSSVHIVKSISILFLRPLHLNPFMYVLEYISSLFAASASSG
jgi:hypothetical protein